MARRLVEPLVGIPDDVKSALQKVRRLTHTGKYHAMREQGIKPITPISEIREIARRKKKKISNVPITISDKIRDKRIEAATQRYKNPKTGKAQVRIWLHPILSYTRKKYVENVIDHEIDHAKVQKRIAQNYNKRR